MDRSVRVGVVAAAAFTAAAAAHPGPRIWVGIDGGQVVTYRGPYPPGDPANYMPAIVFAQPLANEGDDMWSAEFPGFQLVPGGTIPTGSNFRYDIMGPLLWYNEDSPERCPFFQPVDDYFMKLLDVPQMAITNELFATKYTADGFVAGDLVFAYNGSAGDHNHLTYTLLGDGANAGGGADGIYALPLRLTRSGSLPSATFYLLLGKNVTPAKLAEALDALPEPQNISDLDCDGDADLDDLRQFTECTSGPATSPVEGCENADVDRDEDVDLIDFAVFELCHRASGVDEIQCAR